MKWFGLTGGIASGKSTVAQLLVERGIPLVDADEIARAVVEPGTKGLEAVAHAFGPEVIGPDGRLNRRKLGEVVFGNAEKLTLLESLLHPMVQSETAARRLKFAGGGHDFAVYDVPLLFEKNLEKQFDGVILVSTTEQLQRERMALHRGYSPLEIERRLGAQLSIDAKKPRADFIVGNDGDREHLAREVDRLAEWLEKPGASQQ